MLNMAEGILLIVGLLGWVVIVGILVLCLAKDDLRDNEPGAEDRYG